MAVALAAVGAPAVAFAAAASVSSAKLAAGSIAVTYPAAILTSVADTYVDQAAATSSFGSTTAMDVQSRNTNRNRRAYLRFDVSSVPAGSTVVSATLELRLFAAPTAGRTYQVSRATAAWTESLTWNTQPAVAGVTASTATGTTANVTLSWDVKADVQAFINGTATNHGWTVRDSAESSATQYLGRFRTREFGTSAERPTLRVRYV